MKRRFVIVICFFLLFGCAYPPRVFKTDIAAALQPTQLRYSFNITPPNLKEQSQCGTKDVTIRLINAEKRNNNIEVMPRRGCYYGDNGGRNGNGCFLNPREVTDQIIDYLTESYRQCRVYVTDNSPKIITISYPLDQFFYINDYNSSVVMKVIVTIPELNRTFAITTTQASFQLHNSVAYAIHDLSWQIINDPTIQDYILCKK